MNCVHRSFFFQNLAARVFKFGEKLWRTNNLRWIKLSWRVWKDNHCPIITHLWFYCFCFTKTSKLFLSLQCHQHSEQGLLTVLFTFTSVLIYYLSPIHQKAAVSYFMAYLIPELLGRAGAARDSLLTQRVDSDSTMSWTLTLSLLLWMNIFQSCNRSFDSLRVPAWGYQVN